MRIICVYGFMLLFIFVNGCASVQLTYSDKTSGHIARLFHVDEKRVISLEDKGYTNSDIIKVLIISVSSNVSAEEVVRMREEGQGWTTICENLGIDTSAFEKESKHLSEEVGISEEPS